MRYAVSVALKKVSPQKATVRIAIGKNFFEITDQSGGIDIDHARSNVFRLGRVDPKHKTSLGVYGIGLKRAIFKIGNNITIESRTIDTGFRLELDVAQWAADDDSEGWSFPLQQIHKAKSIKDAGTYIRVDNLSSEVMLRLKDPRLLTRLRDHLAKTYTLFLDRLLTISLNGALVDPAPLPIGESADLSPAVRTIELSDVKVELIAGLAARKRGAWTAENAGWYVLCNGRVVVSADKTELTGWGIHSANFASKFRGFVGIAFFFSSDPSKLPWTTTKRGLNADSEVYQLARVEMTKVAKPVLTFLNQMYPSEPAEDINERRLADALKAADVRVLVDRNKPIFVVPARIRSKKKSTVKVQYDAELADIRRVQRKVNKPSLGAGAVGRLTFEYYLKMECSE